MKREEESPKQLEKARRKRVNQAIRALLVDDDVDAAKRHLAWAETAARAAQAGPPKAMHPAREAVVILLACLSVIVLAWSLKTSHNAVKFAVRADGLKFTAGESWAVIEDFGFSRIEGRGLSEVHLPMGQSSAEKFNLSDVDRSGRIRKLTISRNASVEMEFKPGEIQIFIRRGTVSGEISVSSADLVLSKRANDEFRRKLTASKGMPPEFLGFFGTHSDQASPIEIDIATSGGGKFSSLVISDLAFSREDPPRSGNSVSTVQIGSGNLLDVNRKIRLDTGDWLKLEGMSRVRADIDREDQGVTIRFEGTVDRLFAGATENTLADLTPSWFEYLAKQQDIKVIWAALLLLVGLAWRFRGLF